jgi:predicted neuraminidase
VSILDLSDGLDAGGLFRPPDDKLRVDAFVPTIGRQSHAANLVELPNSDLLCAWFAGSREGISDVNIALSRLPHGTARWTEPVWVSENATRSEQNRSLNRRCSYPSIVQTRDGLIHVAYSYRGRQCIKYVRFTEDWVRDQLDWMYPAEGEKRSEL